MGVPSEKVAHAVAMARREVAYALEHSEDEAEREYLREADGKLWQIERRHEGSYDR